MFMSRYMSDLRRYLGSACRLRKTSVCRHPLRLNFFLSQNTTSQSTKYRGCGVCSLRMSQIPLRTQPHLASPWFFARA